MTVVVLKTNMGTIKLELDEKSTPETTQNFLNYLQNGFYTDTLFHRVIPGFMIQGGGFDRDMQQKKGNPPIQNEAKQGIPNEKGTIAMARTSDPHSASSQFFINVADNAFLNHTSETPDGWGYCAFGKVIEGLDVAIKISQVKTTRRMGHSDVPESLVVLEHAELATESDLA